MNIATLASISLLWICCAVATNMILKETLTHQARHDYSIGNRVTAGHLSHDIMISIKQNNQQTLTDIVDDISNPASSNYGKYLSFHEVGRLVSNPSATSAVTMWLLDNSIEILQQSEFGEFIHARSTVAILERVFNAEFYEFEAKSFDDSEVLSPGRVIRALSYSIPQHLDEFIHSVHKFSSIPPVAVQSSTLKPVDQQQAAELVKRSRKLTESNLVTPAMLSAMYNIYGDCNGFGSQSVYGTLGQTYLQSDIAAFLEYFGVPATDSITDFEPIPDNSVCSSDGYYYGAPDRQQCEYATLELEYIKSTTGTLSTSYYYDSLGGPDFIGWITNISNMENPPLVNSISYSTYEVNVATADLNTFAFEAIKLSARGVTIVASAGNDGVAGTVFVNDHRSAVSFADQ